MRKNQTEPKAQSIDPYSIYIRPTYNKLPVKKSDSCNLGIPFVICVTPFPKHDSGLPCASYDYMQSPVCKNCGCVPSNRMVKCPDGYSYLCQVCSGKNAINLSPSILKESVQFSSPSFDMSFHDNCENSPLSSLLIIEKSSIMEEYGLFEKIIYNFYENAKKSLVKYVSVFLVSDALYFPRINRKTGMVSLSKCSDIIDIMIPLPKFTFFDIGTDFSMFNTYVSYVKEVITEIPVFNLADVIDLLSKSYSESNVHSVICMSTMNHGSVSQLRELEEECLISKTQINIFCMIPSSLPPDFSSLSLFSMCNNSHLTVFKPEEIDTIIPHINNRLFGPKYSNVLALAYYPDCFQLNDIKGCGMRRLTKGFACTSLEPGDTIYFCFEYRLSSIDMPTPGFQFQIRYFDSNGNRRVRIFSHHFCLVDNIASVSQESDSTAIISSLMMLSIDKGKEKMDEETILEEIEKHKEAFIENRFAKLFFLSRANDTVCQIRNSFSSSLKLLNFLRSSFIYGLCPEDISLYLAPIAYQLSKTTLNIPSPAFLQGTTLLSDALYIRTDNERGIILISENENYEQWKSHLESREIKYQLSHICREKFIELMYPKLSESNTTYIRISRCMAAK